MGRTGKMVSKVAEIPLAENIPKGFGATQNWTKRNFTWRADKPASLYSGWKRKTKGDPKNKVEVRDRLFYHGSTFQWKKKGQSIGFKFRYSGIVWGDDDSSDCVRILVEYQRTNRQSAFRQPNQSLNKRYSIFLLKMPITTPVSFATTSNAYGRSGITQRCQAIKALPNRYWAPQQKAIDPFIREFDLASKETKELWRSKAPYYEYPIRILDAAEGLVISRRESTKEPPNYYLRNLKDGKLKPLTEFAHPYPGLVGIEKQKIAFKRDDGLDLQGDLYLPKGYNAKRDGRLPVLMWAYPREYKSAAAAKQVSGSPHSFIRLSWGSPLYWVTRGYAVFDRVSMPVVGEGEDEPNDSFRPQLVANAAAAIDKLVEMGIADRSRIGIGGHSYGAFMTANLLAHSDLFAAGIARSGAYNRTLTPFGFQREERTYWEAPEIYYTMSPFMHADKINEPLLMIHGEADNNSGTFPVQSKRLYSAIKGLGGTARLVMLPHESHGYAAKESILHCLWEMDQWMEKYVKKLATP